MPAKKHHYVPVFYQKGFTAADGLLWVYDRKLHTYKRLHPIVVCRAEDLYAVRPKNAPRDRRIETEVLSPIEGDAATVIRRLSPGIVPDHVELRALVRFIALQYTRLPSFGKQVSRALEVQMDEELRLRFGTLERAEETLREIESETGVPQVDAAGMVNAVVNKRVRAHANETAFLQQMFEQASALGVWLENSEWTILVAPQSSCFILGDHPFVSVPQQGMELKGVGYGVPGVTNYFPLTGRLCIRFRRTSYAFRYQSVDSRAVRAVNHNIAANSDRFIMGEELRQLEAVVQRSGCQKLETTERFSVDIIKAEGNESLVTFTIYPRRYFY